ncbi:MAG: double-strand break repair helicase AddA [Rhizobiaceae bacterium]
MSKKKPFKVDEATRLRQTTASDPRNTVWVSANAGSGKTHVLSERVIRLLLEGVAPSKILCLTYTKTAAAEMINRVFERLSAWVVLDDAALAEAMIDIEKRQPDAKRLRTARNLFARALETPGGLQIQTIHAFCTTILKRFPLEANIIGHFELLDDDTDAMFRREAKRGVAIEAYHGGDEALSQAFEKALDVAGESGLDALLDAALSGQERSALQAFLNDLEEGKIGPDFLERFAGLADDESEEKVVQNAWPLASLPVTAMQAIIAAVTSNTGVTIANFADGLFQALNEQRPIERFEILAPLFLTKDGSARSPKNYQKTVPNFEAAAQEILEIKDRLARSAMVETSKAAHILLSRLMSIHTAMKREGGFLDYEDLIEATQRLLQRDYAAAWVQYKLDQGIDHVLVDEAQDTSPRQWSIVNTLTSDFFAGETAAKSNRTLFVVGDEKQSIYSFQGARPEVFAETGHEKAKLLGKINRPFEKVIFSLSFRSTPEVLKAVDHVFAATGVSGDGEPTVHESIRQKQHGHVEVWDVIAGEKSQGEDDWTKPVDHATAPTVMLATDVANTIKKLVTNHTNPASGKIVQPGDILVLVRKRDKFMHALSKELKGLQVPVAGADRLVLTSHIAILDLMAAARITLQPDDDLSLAALLRSPIFGLSDDALTELASERKGAVSLLDRLKERAQADDTLKAIADDLQRWRDTADFVPVYEFFAHILGRDGGRAKLIARLGEEASDIIDEFLSYALVAERSGLLGLQQFVETLDRAAPEIKRESGAQRNEVRIMTVHGAKGLEAPYVFLVDPGSNPVSSRHMAPLIKIPLTMGNQTVSGFVWVPKKELVNSSIEEQRAEMSALQLAEYKRLLYVGMTRAEDVLIVCGYRGTQKSSEPTWSDMVYDGLSGKDGTSKHNHPVTGKPVLYFKLGTSELQTPTDATKAEPAPGKLPDWLSEKLPPIILPPRPLTPSGLGVVIDPQAESSKLSPVFDATPSETNTALQRGSAVHRLLEVLPGIAPQERTAAARRYLERKVPDENHDRLIGKVMEILDDPLFAAVFSQNSRAEVSIGGKLELGGETRSISGKIDRLAVTDTSVLIVDYKTNRPAPDRLSDVPDSHIAQLALYRAVLAPLYPEKKIEAALIYTEGPHFISVDAIRLDTALAALTGS